MQKKDVFKIILDWYIKYVLIVYFSALDNPLEGTPLQMFHIPRELNRAVNNKQKLKELR